MWQGCICKLSKLHGIDYILEWYFTTLIFMESFHQALTIEWIFSGGEGGWGRIKMIVKKNNVFLLSGGE